MSESPRWLLLAYQLSSKSSNGRVTTWRRLQQLGAIQARHAVYALPNTAEGREDFEWLCSEIVALGGEATVFAADAVNTGAGDDLVKTFQQSRAHDYRVLKKDVDRALGAVRRRQLTPPARKRVLRSVRGFRDRLTAIEQIDFFHAGEHDKTAAAVVALERAVSSESEATMARTSALRTEDFVGRTWTTRPRPGIDRMASAWLIRRFIDPLATFVFAQDPREADLTFDMYSGEFSHQGSSCTFEVLVERFSLTNPVVTRIGQIVHDLDMKEVKFAPPDAPTIGRMVEGLRAVHADDHQLLEQGIAMFEALARSFASTEVVRPAPSGRSVKRKSAARSTQKPRRHS
jgi:hypothetical protein